MGVALLPAISSLKYVNKISLKRRLIYHCVVNLFHLDLPLLNTSIGDTLEN